MYSLNVGFSPPYFHGCIKMNIECQQKCQKIDENPDTDVGCCANTALLAENPGRYPFIKILKCQRHVGGLIIMKAEAHYECRDKQSGIGGKKTGKGHPQPQQ